MQREVATLRQDRDALLGAMRKLRSTFARQVGCRFLLVSLHLCGDVDVRHLHRGCSFVESYPARKTLPLPACGCIPTSLRTNWVLLCKVILQIHQRMCITDSTFSMTEVTCDCIALHYVDYGHGHTVHACVQVQSREAAAAAAGHARAESEAAGRARDERWREEEARGVEGHALRAALRRAVADAERQMLASQGVLSQRLAELEPRLWAAEDSAAAVSRCAFRFC